jgi:hypothetical protein
MPDLFVRLQTKMSEIFLENDFFSVIKSRKHKDRHRHGRMFRFVVNRREWALQL